MSVMTPRQILLSAAALLLLAGLALGLAPPSVADVSCGSVLTGLSSDAQSAILAENEPDLKAECDGKLDDRRLPVYGLLGLGIIAAIVSVVAPTGQKPARAEDPRFRSL